MKRNIPILIFVFCLACLPSFAQGERLIEWITDTEYDFGDLEQDVPAETIFTFKNTSDQTITIENVRTTCGCTAPDWSPEPILPGENGTIKIEYDAHKPRYFRKRILVFITEQKKGEKLYVSGYVEEV